jgi:hypothetical protein
VLPTISAAIAIGEKTPRSGVGHDERTEIGAERFRRKADDDLV